MDVKSRSRGESISGNVELYGREEGRYTLVPAGIKPNMPYELNITVSDTQALEVLTHFLIPFNTSDITLPAIQTSVVQIDAKPGSISIEFPVINEAGE